MQTMQILRILTIFAGTSLFKHKMIFSESFKDTHYLTISIIFFACPLLFAGSNQNLSNALMQTRCINMIEEMHERIIFNDCSLRDR